MNALVTWLNRLLRLKRPLRGSADSQFLNHQRRCSDYPGRYA